MRKTMVAMIFGILFLTACSSDNTDVKSEENKQEEHVSANVDENVDPNEENEENNEGENAPFPESDIVFSEFEEEPILVDDLDENNMIKIDDEELSGLAIVYGDGELVSLKLNRTFRYDVETGDVIWEARNWPSPSEIFSFEDGVLHYSGSSIMKGDVTTGEVVDKIKFDEEDGFEEYITYNDPYRIALLGDSVQVTNEDTNKSVKLIEDSKEYYATALMENVSATEKDNIVTTYDNETGEQLAEKEFPGETYMYAKDGTDELYVIYEPERDQYGHITLLLDGETLDEKAEYEVNNSNGGYYVAHDHVFYSDPVEETLVALNGDLTEERYRFEIGGVSQHELFYADDDYIYFVDRDPEEPSVVNLIQFDAETGEVEQFIQFPHMLIRDFYVLDDKLYLQFDGTETEYVYYVIDQDDVHRSMDK